MTAAYAKKLLAILRDDRDRLKRIERYLAGDHDDPYMPDTADEEYRLLAKRAISNWLPFLVDTPVQAMYVDGFRRGGSSGGTESRKGDTSSHDTPEWTHWQKSRLDARQTPIMRAALAYGHSFTLTEQTKNKVITKGLSPVRTAAIYEDPANDDAPVAALTITKYPDAKAKTPGKARMWDESHEWEVTYQHENDETKVSVKRLKKHGNSECPVTRFTAYIDLEGNTEGIVERFIPVNDRLNQTVFDLLVAQTYASFKVRWVTGMAPPLEMEPVYELDLDGNKVIDESGQPIIEDWKPKVVNGQYVPKRINHNASRFLFAEDENVKFGSLDETPLAGFIESVDMSIRHLSALSQTPPHHLLGQIANLSAEALNAAETAFSRKVEMFRTTFGESWERVFRLAAELEGDAAAFEDQAGEVVWRDMEARSLSQVADALGKLSEQLQIPRKGLWRMVPGVTQTQLDEWDDLWEEEDATRALQVAAQRATQPLTAARIQQPSTRAEAPEPVAA